MAGNEGAPVAEVDHYANGMAILETLGVGSLATLAVTGGNGDQCIGTMADAISRHTMVRGLVEDAVAMRDATGLELDKVLEISSLRHALLRDGDGELIHATSVEEAKKKLG